MGDALRSLEQAGQGTPAAPFGGLLQGLRDSFARNVFGQEEVPLFETRAPIESRGPTTIVGGNGQYIVTPDLAPIDQTNALFNDPAFYNAIVAGVPVGQMQQSNMAPILDALNQSILQGTSTMEQFGPQFTGGGGFGQTNESSFLRQRFWRRKRSRQLRHLLRHFRFPLTPRQPASLQWPRWSINEH
jgi:hypothetical protein